MADRKPTTPWPTGWANYEDREEWSPELACNECGWPHLIDTSLPSEIWNQIAEPHEMLCANCIDKRLDKAGIVAEAEFYFSGKALHSRMYDESYGDIQANVERKADCKRGHPFTEENTYVDKRGHRHCRACKRQYGRAQRRLLGGS